MGDWRLTECDETLWVIFVGELSCCVALMFCSRWPCCIFGNFFLHNVSYLLFLPGYAHVRIGTCSSHGYCTVYPQSGRHVLRHSPNQMWWSKVNLTQSSHIRQPWRGWQVFQVRQKMKHESCLSSFLNQVWQLNMKFAWFSWMIQNQTQLRERERETSKISWFLWPLITVSTA